MPWPCERGGEESEKERLGQTVPCWVGVRDLRHYGADTKMMGLGGTGVSLWMGQSILPLHIYVEEK